MANQTNSHPGNCFRDLRYLPAPTPPGSRSLYPAPQLLENLPLRTTKGSSDRPFVCTDKGKHDNEASSIEYSSGSESFPLRNPEPQSSNISGSPGSRFPSAPPPPPATPPPATPPAAATTTTAQPQLSLTRTQFESVTAHTAKCDLCNARNDSGMSRCSSCGWQSCHACTIKNGCTRTHNAGSRVHTGPIDQNELVENNSPKGKKKKGKGTGKVIRNQRGPARRGRGRGREQAQTPCTQSQAQTQRGQGQGARRARTPSPTVSSSPDAAVSPPPFPSTDSNGHQSAVAPLPDEAFSPSTTTATTDADEAEAETDKDLAGARNLYAFSLEAHGVWIQEEGEKDPARRWCYQAYELGDLHWCAQDQAARAVEEFREREGVVGGDGGRVGLF